MKSNITIKIVAEYTHSLKVVSYKKNDKTFFPIVNKYRIVVSIFNNQYIKRVSSLECYLDL